MNRHIATFTAVILTLLGSLTTALAQPQPPVTGTDYFTNVINMPLTAFVSELLTNDISDPLNPLGSALALISTSPTSTYGGSVTMLSGSWTNIYDGGGSVDGANSLKLDDSGNVYVNGSSDANGSGYDYLTIKYSSAGLALWTNRFNGTGNGEDDSFSMVVDGSGNVYVTGRSTGSGGNLDFATIKYSSAGAPVWTNRFNGASNGSDEAYSLAVDGSGNVYVTGNSHGGSSYSDGGSDDDYATIKYSSAGVALWTNVFNGNGVKSVIM